MWPNQWLISFHCRSPPHIAPAIDFLPSCNSLLPSPFITCNATVNFTDIANLWHARMGHLSDFVLQALSNKVPFSLNAKFTSDACNICPLAKQKHLSFLAHHHVSPPIFDLIHCDAWGPFSQHTHDGYQYFLTIVDDNSRFTWVLLMKHKYDAPQLIKTFFKYVETQFDKTIKAIRTDNAREFSLTDFLQNLGSLHQFSCPYRPQQNVVVERKHRHFLNVARSLMFRAVVPLTY